MIDVDARKPKTDRSLMHGLNFSAEDLAANRDGYMTFEQRARLRRRAMLDAGSYLAFACLVGLFFFMMLSVAFSDNVPSSLILGGLLTLTGMFGLGTVIVFGAMAHRWRLYRADLYKGDVSTTAGSVSLDIQDWGRRASYKVRVERLTFDVSKKALLAFKNGERYRVYYAPNSKTLLSAEPMPDDEMIADSYNAEYG